MEHKVASMQTAFEGTNLNGEQTKKKMGRGIMPIRTFILKVIKDERNILTHHEINRNSEQIV